MTSSGWDEYVSDVPVGESDADYAGFDAAAASAVSTDLVDGVLAGESPDTAAGDVAAGQGWVDWNSAPADGWTPLTDGHLAGEPYGTAADYAEVDPHTPDQDFGGHHSWGDGAS